MTYSAVGKTHTILGTAQDPGLISRCIKDIFALIDSEKRSCENQWTYDVMYSYLEIYQEKVMVRCSLLHCALVLVDLDLFNRIN